MVIFLEAWIFMVNDAEFSKDNKYPEVKSPIPCPHDGKNYEETFLDWRDSVLHSCRNICGRIFYNSCSVLQRWKHSGTWNISKVWLAKNHLYCTADISLNLVKMFIDLVYVLNFLFWTWYGLRSFWLEATTKTKWRMKQKKYVYTKINTSVHGNHIWNFIKGSHSGDSIQVFIHFSQETLTWVMVRQSLQNHIREDTGNWAEHLGHAKWVPFHW